MEKKKNPIIDEPVEQPVEGVVEKQEVVEAPKAKEVKAQLPEPPAGYVHVESIAGKTKGRIYTIPKAFYENRKDFYSEENGYKLR